MNTKRIGWSGEELDAILDRRPAKRSEPERVGYDPRELERLLGR